MVTEINEFMSKYGMNQKQFAKFLELDKFTVNRWLKGKQNLSKTNQKYVKIKMDEFELKLLTTSNQVATI